MICLNPMPWRKEGTIWTFCESLAIFNVPGAITTDRSLEIDCSASRSLSRQKHLGCWEYQHGIEDAAANRPPLVDRLLPKFGWPGKMKAHVSLSDIEAYAYIDAHHLGFSGPSAQ